MSDTWLFNVQTQLTSACCDTRIEIPRVIVSSTASNVLIHGGVGAPFILQGTPEAGEYQVFSTSYDFNRYYITGCDINILYHWTSRSSNLSLSLDLVTCH